MDIQDLKRILTSFADEPSDVDIRSGRITAQIRDDLIDATLSYDGDQNILVEENGVKQHWRPWIIQRVAKLPQLADRILSTGRPASEENGRAPFVAPKATFTGDLAARGESVVDEIKDDAANALIQIATNFIPGTSSVLYLTSDAGEGKTTLINRVAYDQALRYKRKEASCLLLPIPLSGKAFLTFDDAVVAALSNRFRFGYYYYDAFLQLVKLGAIVPAFDGYEEMLVEGSKGEAVSALGNLVQSLDSTGSVVIAARKAFFEYLSFRTQARLFDAIGDRSASFGRLQLTRWDKELFCQYGTRRGVEDPEGVYETVATRLGSEHPLVTRAVLVNRLFDVAAQAEDRAHLGDKLGAHPHDYFYTFVDAIVQREASEKWLAMVAGEIREPLLTLREHHLLLASLAQEMWQTSTTSLRYDVVDVLADIFSETHEKTSQANRQIKERIRQHSLLTAEPSRSTGLAFDHEDFQTFYLGESLGGLLMTGRQIEVRTFLQVNLLPSATIEQAVQYLDRHGADLPATLEMLKAINDQETGFSFCKENCSAILVRIAELRSRDNGSLSLERLLVSADGLEGRILHNLSFVKCVFQPTAIDGQRLEKVAFINCEFERLELDESTTLAGVQFQDCHIDSLVVRAEDLQTFDPQLIRDRLRRAGASLHTGLFDDQQVQQPEDERTKAAERFFRSFTRRTHIDDSILKIRMGRNLAPVLLDDVLPELLSHNIIGEIRWSGQGVQRRFKLLAPMTDVYRALEVAAGDFEAFLIAMKQSSAQDRR
ncbi:hypothetical protein [Dyella kyungheensis]|uniref:Pentapeptide repeat protein n=1 Tax=Dyella kyungheensis TaxID=1242174 RepID=A0ABS2JSX6_9GAMM|nr:hypothetical protein [Dyella kyungheensis]MBM7122132.1 hypothetical protein [Dyella kyungheensis]